MKYLLFQHLDLVLTFSELLLSVFGLGFELVFQLLVLFDQLLVLLFVLGLGVLRGVGSGGRDWLIILLVVGFLGVFLLGDGIAVRIGGVGTIRRGLEFGVFLLYVVGGFDRKILPHFFSKRVSIKRWLPRWRAPHRLIINMTFLPTTIIRIPIKIPFPLLTL